MTHEEAARILDLETNRDALRKYEGEDARLEACNEDCRGQQRGCGVQMPEPPKED